LFDVGGELAIPGQVTLTALYAEKIERELDELNASLPPLKEFILPGGGAGAVACHIARTVCRRAERRLVALASEGEPVNPHSLRYLNRLSDFLFVLARVLARADRGEVFWEPGRNRD
jgi:cob(I)alamin adenosyltransferase